VHGGRVGPMMAGGEPVIRHQDGVYASGHTRARTEVMNTDRLIIVIGALALIALLLFWSGVF
jgi:hypothetical protein